MHLIAVALHTASNDAFGSAQYTLQHSVQRLHRVGQLSRLEPFQFRNKHKNNQGQRAFLESESIGKFLSSFKASFQSLLYLRPVCQSTDLTTSNSKSYKSLYKL